MTSRLMASTVALACLLALPGCFLKPKKKSSKKASSSSELLDKDSIFMDRVGDGDVARLQFKTRRAALCELAYYSQDENTPPKKDAPTVVPCSGATEPRTDFTEQITSLRSDSLYYVVITVWEGGATKADGEETIVKETGAGSDGPNADGKLAQLFVARLDVPTRMAEVHRHQLPEPAEVSAIRSKLQRKLGCQSGTPENTAAFREAAPDLGIKNLATRDFGSGASNAHPDYPDRLQIPFASLNDGVDKWSLMYTYNGKDTIVPARPMSRILNMEMESTSVAAFDAPTLEEAAEALKIDAAKPLKLKWTTPNNLLESSYLTVQIGLPSDDKAVYCVFEASKGAAEIEPKLLQALEDGRHTVLAELSTNQIWAKDGWLVSVHDWRAGRIEK